mgnify:CR=1 FL=1
MVVVVSNGKPFKVPYDDVSLFQRFKRFDENKRLKKGQILSTTTLTTAKGVNVIIKSTTTLSDD